MKKVLVISAIAALGLSTVALAGGLSEEPVAPVATSSDQGVYVGLSGGFGMTHWKNIELSGVNAIGKDNGLVGRGFLGYDINRYFAVEAGFTYFFNKPSFTFVPTGNTTVDNVKTYSFDVYGKGKLPVVDNFDLYAKLGGCYLTSKNGKQMTSETETGGVSNFNIAYGAGADYYITPNVIASIEWLHNNGAERVQDAADGKYQPHTDAFLVGLRYKWEV